MTSNELTIINENNEQVQRNIEKFPSDMMFRLNKEDCLRCQFGTLEHIENVIDKESLRSQFATLDNATKGRGKYSKYLPYAFTEQGIYMLKV